MSGPIAIVGVGCRYPDAADPDQLWEVVVARRRPFRRIPRARLSLDDYGASDQQDPDRTYLRYAAVLQGWRFDRARFHVPGPAYRVTDLTHWLALEVASDTLAAAGFADARGLDRDRVGVVIGNTLTGEFSRSSLMRLRWPYVRRVLQDALTDEGWDAEAQARLLARIEDSYKAPFPEPNDESLAGGLANTIAGRICNHFDLHGGGFTVDGACASSLLAVITACTALVNRDVDVALAGGVDLSLDPFELVGFARTGALATSEMRVYDERPTGFWPGEGCGMVALMRAEDAVAYGRQPLALIQGWGVSSDGQGGISRPEPGGQLLAIERAYQRAGFGPQTVALFEGHGTGTAVGDQVELETLIAAQRQRRTLPPAALGTIKANFGHTKAAAGVAGLIKATLALQHQVIPPTTGCDSPHRLLRSARSPLRVVDEAEPWSGAPLRAAVSAMGFGGINTHLVLESPEVSSRSRVTPREVRLTRRPLSHELFILAGDSRDEIVARLRRLAEVADQASFAEHVDLAASLAADVATRGVVGEYRVSIVAADPPQLVRRARQAAELGDAATLDAGRLASAPGIFFGRGPACRVGLLFPGQGARIPAGAGALGVVFPQCGSDFSGLGPPESADTAVAQPAIFRASLGALRWLTRLGVAADAAVGHSVGEITALCWAGALTESAALELVTTRGQIMNQLAEAGTGMVSLAANPELVRQLISGTRVVVAADNGSTQVVAGCLAELDQVVERARVAGVAAHVLTVSHGFHSPAMDRVAPAFAAHLRTVPLGPTRRTVYSTVTGRKLADHDLADVLTRQITAPVLFRQAVSALAADCGLLVEVGPGHMLASLATSIVDVPAVALAAGAESAEGLCQVTGALFAAGVVGDLRPLFAERFWRPYDLSRDPVFLENPCEQAPDLQAPDLQAPHPQAVDVAELPVASPVRNTLPATETASSVADVVRSVIAAALELPPDAVGDSDRLLADLHLNSLKAVQLATQAASRCGKALPTVPLSLADARVCDLVTAIAALPAREAGDAAAEDRPPGVAEWHRVLMEDAEPIDLATGDRAFNWQVRGQAPLRGIIEPLLPDDRHASPAVLVVLPEDPPEAAIRELLDAVRGAVAAGEPVTVVEQGDSASGYLATIRQEHPERSVRWIRTAATPEAARTVVRILASPVETYPEVVVTSAGAACVPTFLPLALGEERTSFPLGPSDVVLVTGGGKGIGFETALALSRRYGVRLALLGRSRPADDLELAGNLTRLEEVGCTFRYETADVGVTAAVRAAVQAATSELGAITAIVHSAGVNRPARYLHLDQDAYHGHAAPKYHGLRAVLDAVDRDRLRLLVTYGSVIGRFGLPGEAHYALANGRMRELARVLTEQLPACQVHNVDWTVWSGAGMGQRLDVLDSLVRAGVVPLPADRGVELLISLLASKARPGSVLVTGRLPQLDRGPSGPSREHRYVRRVRSHTAGVELVAEAELSGGDDLYLDDHRIDGMRVLPAVCALEAMAQAAHFLTGTPVTGVVDGRFERPVIVPEEGIRTLRLCALVRHDGDVSVVLRSEETGFAVDHFAGSFTTRPANPPEVNIDHQAVPAHRAAELYGPLFFHGPIFHRLRRYERLAATGCTAVLAEGAPWFFGPRLPSLLQLGDPARNDATVHVLQACVPHRRLLPVACDRFTVHGEGAGAGELLLAATERAHTGLDYTYDVVLRDGAGLPVLSWQGLRLRDVGPLPTWGSWPAVLLGPYLQRSVAALIPGADVMLEVGSRADKGRTDRGRTAGANAGNGRSGSVAARRRSRSHLDGVVLTASSRTVVACDWEWIGERVEDIAWVRELTPWTAQADQLTKVTDEPEGHVLTRLWTVQECLSKAGRTAQGPLTVRGAYEHGWVLLRAGDHQVASAVLRIDGDPRPIALAVLVESEA